ncbi:hypothetical protein K7X08_036508 [Anisodus acutangulus]|uniref:Uncharacterized protein n=1 Tax=Anisodus acutangulus TaxID=402998 RepID=A0A9Q1L5E7_9SOLA|nr:hypothetical protein K7X08_036508 [Anisodus acutangulus]
MGAMTVIDILLAIILPPLGVFLKFGCKVEFWICVLLTLFGWLPAGISLKLDSIWSRNTKICLTSQPIYRKGRMGTATFIDILLAILLPPLGVFLKFNCAAEFWILIIISFLKVDM